MKILTVHNRYRYRGGEDESREAEDTLLGEKGHEIRQLVFDNSTITKRNVIKVGFEACWSCGSYRLVRKYLAEWPPDILDVHNFFPLASPSVYYAGKRCGIPVVQTLHNYRLLCPGANFYRNGAICEDCTRHSVPWPGVIHGCYRASFAQTAAVALMVTVHRAAGTWESMISAYITVSEFARRKFIEGGLPEKKIFVKPNFVFDSGLTGCEEKKDFVYVGRLSPEKGVGTLLHSIREVQSPLRFRIAGDGPMEPMVRAAALRDPRIEYLGWLPQRQALSVMAAAGFVILPSECYETFGRAAAEAFSVGTPVICARIGALIEMVDPGRTGFDFEPAHPQELARVIERAAANPERAGSMRAAARAEYECRYTPERNYQMLMRIYESVTRTAQETAVRGNGSSRI